VKDVDINITLERIAQNFQLSYKGVDIFNLDLHDFEYLDGETALTASRFLHDFENPAIVRNKEVKYYTLPAQVLTKIVFNDLLPKLREYSHVWGYAPLLIYCLLKSDRQKASTRISKEMWIDVTAFAIPL